MKFLFPEKVVNKIFLTLVILIASLNVHSQDQTLNSDYIAEVSESILEKKIIFYWNGGSLTKALEKIASDNQIKFSYANNRIESLKTEVFQYEEIKLFDLLNLLFKNTKFNYTIVGRLIVVYKDENKSQAPDVFNSQSQQLFGDTLNLVDSIKTSSDSIFNKEDFKIYSPASKVDLPPDLKRTLQKIYKQELEWAIKYKKKQEKLAKDDSGKSKPESKTDLKILDYNKFYVGITTAYIINLVKWKDQSPFPWREDLMWKAEWNNSINPEINFGIKLKNFMVGSGVGFQTFKIKNSFVETTKKGKPKPPPPGNTEFIPEVLQENYNIFSIPLTIHYQMHWRKWTLGLGAGARINFVKGKNESSKLLKKYHNEEAGNKLYSENFQKKFYSLFTDAYVEYLITPKFFVSGGVTYTHALTSFYNNSLFSFKINSVGIKLGLFYQINISGKR